MMISTKKPGNRAQTATAIKHRGGSVYIPKVGPSVIGGGNLLKKRYEKLYNMILYDIIRYHNPDPPPRGSLGPTIFFEFLLPGF